MAVVGEDSKKDHAKVEVQPKRLFLAFVLTAMLALAIFAGWEGWQALDPLWRATGGVRATTRLMDYLLNIAPWWIRGPSLIVVGIGFAGLGLNAATFVFSRQPFATLDESGIRFRQYGRNYDAHWNELASVEATQVTTEYSSSKMIRIAFHPGIPRTWYGMRRSLNLAPIAVNFDSVEVIRLISRMRPDLCANLLTEAMRLKILRPAPEKPEDVGRGNGPSLPPEPPIVTDSKRWTG